MTGVVKTVALSFRVRAMREEDVSRVTKIDREAFPGMLPPTNFQRELKNPLTHYQVAVSDDRLEPPHPAPIWRRLWPRHGVHEVPGVVGFAGFWLVTDEAHVVSIAVARDYRRLGIGEALFIAILELARSLQARVLTLEVRASNLAAQSLYRKYGLKETGVRRGYYVEYHEDAIIMTANDIGGAEYGAFLEGMKREYLSRYSLDPFE